MKLSGCPPIELTVDDAALVAGLRRAREARTMATHYQDGGKLLEAIHKALRLQQPIRSAVLQVSMDEPTIAQVELILSGEENRALAEHLDPIIADPSSPGPD
jgi:hypothetical protein